MITDVIGKTAEHVRGVLLGEPSGHDWWHVHRVWRTATAIGRQEQGADLDVVQLGALLHDIADWKLHGGDIHVGPATAREWLLRCAVDEPVIAHVCEIVATVSFNGAGVPDTHPTLEARIVQDADRLDAIGAIGIARTFAFGGAHRREIFDPDRVPELHRTAEGYRANSSPTINHFYEKLLLLRDRMNTEAGRRIAEDRHRFMEDFLDRFHREWNGEL